MRSFLALFFVAMVVGAILTPVVRGLALRWGAVSKPGGRNVNERAVPRYGGIAICVAFLASIGALYLSSASTAIVIHAESRRVVALGLGAVGLCLVGALDDTRPIRALYKLYAQIIAAFIAFAGGFRIDAVLLPGLGTLSMGVFALPVTVLWIVGITNAINLIDGLDGLAGGVVFFAAVTNLVVAQVTGATFVGIVMSAVLGGVLGFLVFNFNPARIFMGDAGSYFLGFVLGTMSLAGSSQKASTAVSLLVPVLALGLPIVDTLLSILRRFLERRPLFSPDRGHIHHRLLDMGLTQRRAVLLLYAICLVFTVASVAVSLGRSWVVGVALLIASVAVVGIVRFVGYFEYLFLIRRQKSRLRTRETELLRAVVAEAPLLLSSARTEGQVWSTFESLATRAGMAASELVRKMDGADNEVMRWGEARASLATSAEAVSARYPIGSDRFARADLRFRWRSESGDVSPQTEVLLQVLVDVVTHALTRVGSVHSPLPADLPAPVDESHPVPALGPQGSA